MRNLDQEERPATVPPEGARSPVRHWWEPWRQQGCPDFDDFVTAHGRLTPDQALAVLRYDQHQRWHGGERPPAESYLGRYRLLGEDGDAGLLLVYSEFALRQELGEGPALAEYQGRFPHYADGLRQHHALHAALAAAAQSTVRAARPLSTGGGPAPAPPGPAGPGGPAIPGYEVLGELGRGGMGVVYLARQVALDRLVALKMILAGSHAGDQELARFRTEAEAVARLQHPHIVQIHEVGAQGGLPYFSLEFCPGGSLDKKLAGTPLPPAAAAALVEKLARAMQAAHHKGVLHRDLKPANVLLAEDGTPKVTDFGLAKKLGGAGQTQSGAVMGTPSYMAPEQAEGRPGAVGPAADVYALGAILYECLTGRPPFRAETPLETLLQVRTAEPVPPGRLVPKVPRDLETICLKCLRKEPPKRYPSALELADDLRRFLEDRPIRARPVGRAERLWRWGRRNPAVAGLLAALLLVVAGALAGLTGLWLRAERLRGLAEQKKSEAEDNWGKARADYGLARESVDRYATRVSEDLRLRQEDLRPLRKELLETVVPFYERLIERHADEPDVQAERARAYRRLARITEEIDDTSKAVPLYEKAAALLDRLAQADPGDRQLLRDLTGARTSLINLLHQTGQTPRAVAESERLLRLQERLARDHPDDPAFQDDLANNHNNLGVLYLETGKLDRAEVHLHEARKILEPLSRRPPETAGYRQRLAVCRSTLAQLYAGTGRTSRAEEEYQAAVQDLQTLADARPGDTDPQRELAVTRRDLGTLYQATGRAPAAAAEYQKAIEVLESLVRRQPSVTDHHRQLAICQVRLAGLFHQTGRTAEAEAAYRRALDFYGRLIGQNPKARFLRDYLADAHNGLGGLYLQAGRTGAAEEEFRKALRTREELARDNPAIPEYRRGLALGRMNLAGVYVQTGRPALAEPEFRDALKVLQGLAEQAPKVAEYQSALTACRLNLGTLYFRTGRPAQALEQYQKALPVSERLVRENPGVTAHALTLGMLYDNVGTVLGTQGQREAALEWAGRAVDVLKGLHEKEPDHVQAKRQLRGAYADRARALNRLGRPAEALPDCEQALRLETGQPGHAVRVLRALTRARLGDLAPALTEADELAQVKVLSGQACYGLACLHALAATAAGKDGRLPPAERKERAGRQAARAVALLGRAQGAGFFQQPANRERLKKDGDLEPLRSREEFQKLLRQVEEAAKPMAK
jgi:serine/threonine-protein kinase